MSDYGEDEHAEARSLAPAGGFGRYGSSVEHHMVKLKIEAVDTRCTGSSIDRHVLKETFEMDTVRDGTGSKKHIVKGELEEVDTITSGGHHHRLGHHGHGVDTGGHHHRHHYGHGDTGGHHHHHRAHHGHDVVVRETRVQEDKETFFARDD